MEAAHAVAMADASVIRGASIAEEAHASGIYTFECYDQQGRLKWCESIRNVVVTVGRNAALDAFLAGNPYTVVGPFIGLIAATGYSQVAVTDTMASHPGWFEAGGGTDPKYSNTRPTTVFAAAANATKTLSSYAQFTFTTAGALKGAFLVFGAGATNVQDSTTGVLYSASTFVTGDKTIQVNDVLNVNYSASM
jgi:hypothetical protein